MQQQEPQRPGPDLIDDLITLGRRAIRLGQEWEPQAEHVIELKKAHVACVERKVAAIKRKHRWRNGRPVPPAMKTQLAELAAAPLPSAFRKAIDAERATAAEGREVIDGAIEIATRVPGDHGRFVGALAGLRSFWFAGAEDAVPPIDEIIDERPLRDYLTDIAKDIRDLRASAYYGKIIWRSSRWYTKVTNGALRGDNLRKIKGVKSRPHKTTTEPMPDGASVDREARLVCWKEPAPSGGTRRREAPLASNGSHIVEVKEWEYEVNSVIEARQDCADMIRSALS